MGQPKVTAIILNRNRPDETERCVQSIKNQTFKDIEIVVHDNSSLNLGVALPSNIHAKKSNAEYIFFIDNDAYLTVPNYIQRLVDQMDEDPLCAFCFGRVVNPNGSDQWIELFNLSSPVELQKCNWFNGCGVLIRRDIYLKCGGYNPYFFAYYLEPDIAARMYKAGYYGMYVPIPLVHEQTIKQRNVPFVNYLLIRNGIVFNFREQKYAKIIRRFAWGMLNTDIKTYLTAIYDSFRMITNGRYYYP